MSDKYNNSGIRLDGILFLIFLTLKLCNVIDWSWWWVTSPLWIPVALLVIAAAMAAVVMILFSAFKR